MHCRSICTIIVALQLFKFTVCAQPQRLPYIQPIRSYDFETTLADSACDLTGVPGDSTKVTYEDGPRGNAVCFDDTYMEVPYVPLNHSYTVATWFKMKEHETGTDRVFGLTASNGTFDWGLTVRISPFSVRLKEKDNSKPIKKVTDSHPDPGKWVHVAVTFTPDDKLVFYVDGWVVYTHAEYYPKSLQDVLGTSAPYLYNIGKAPKANGTIPKCYDDFRIYNVALSEEQIQCLALNTYTGPDVCQTQRPAGTESNLSATECGKKPKPKPKPGKKPCKKGKKCKKPCKKGKKCKKPCKKGKKCKKPKGKKPCKKGKNCKKPN